MFALALQCPTCGLQLRHGKELLVRLSRRRGSTRCPRCRDRIHFDATGNTLEISFPDLYAYDSKNRSADIARETQSPPHATESEERHSHVALRSTETEPSADLAHISSPPLPSDLVAQLDEEEPVFPLLFSRRLYRHG